MKPHNQVCSGSNNIKSWLVPDNLWLEQLTKKRFISEPFKVSVILVLATLSFSSIDAFPTGGVDRLRRLPW